MESSKKGWVFGIENFIEKKEKIGTDIIVATPSLFFGKEDYKDKDKVVTDYSFGVVLFCWVFKISYLGRCKD